MFFLATGSPAIVPALRGPPARSWKLTLTTENLLIEVEDASGGSLAGTRFVRRGRASLAGWRWPAGAAVGVAAVAVALELLVLFAPAGEGASELGIVLASRDADPSVAADKFAARAAIERANTAWLAAFSSGNFAEMAALYSDDASLSAPGTDPLEGRESILGYLSSRRGRGMSDPFLKTLDVVTMGDVAYETGTYGFSSGAEGGLAGVETGKYFVIWKAGSDGTWRYNLGIWTSNSASPRPR